VYTVPSLEKIHWDDFNAIMKGAWQHRKKSHTPLVTSWKANQAKYHEVNFSCLYLINLIKKIFLKR
jgi:hypothetical protein